MYNFFFFFGFETVTYQIEFLSTFDVNCLFPRFPSSRPAIYFDCLSDISERPTISIFNAGIKRVKKLKSS